MFDKLLQRLFTHDELGWTEYHEVFWRYNIYKCKYFNLYVHRIDAPEAIPQCHTHPWWFVTFIMWNGYRERIGNQYFRRRPGYLKYHPATFSHTATTPWGRSWSLVLTGPRSNEWQNEECK